MSARRDFARRPLQAEHLLQLRGRVSAAAGVRHRQRRADAQRREEDVAALVILRQHLRQVGDARGIREWLGDGAGWLGRSGDCLVCDVFAWVWSKVRWVDGEKERERERERGREKKYLVV